METKAVKKKHCAVKDCKYPGLPIQGKMVFYCGFCKVVVHHLCTIDNGLYDEIDEKIVYCNLGCKQRREDELRKKRRRKQQEEANNGSIILLEF